jgi:nitrogenase molybdenum-iron protein NifN
VESRSGPAALEEDLVALFPSIVSPADVRQLRQLARACGRRPVLVPDYGESWDGALWSTWQSLPEGPTGLPEIAGLCAAGRIIAVGGVLPPGETAADLVAHRAGRAALHLDLPIGVRATDRLLSALGGEMEAGRPSDIARERSLLLDSYVDAHKLLSGRKVALWGEVDLVSALAAFCYEIGLVPVVCASGSADRTLAERIEARRPAGAPMALTLPDSDFARIEDACREQGAELLVGNSKGYPMARALGRPLLRVGFPVHDRLNGGRMRLLGYAGTLELLDRITDALIGAEQASSPVGYMNY